MFTVPRRKGESQQERQAADRLTQLGRSLRELGIGSILANSPQAKGRERSFLTARSPGETTAARQSLHSGRFYCCRVIWAPVDLARAPPVGPAR
jgi:hypothetical protein